MVADIPKLSATDFLLALYRLEGKDWQWKKSSLGNQKGIYPDGELSAWGTIGGVLSGMNDSGSTQYIREAFLKKHQTTQNDSEDTWY